MQFVILGLDGTDPEAPARRQAARPHHIAMGEKLLSSKNLWYGAALLNDDGSMKGSMYVINFENREALDNWLQEEPYVKGDVWQEITIHTSNTRDPWQYSHIREWFETKSPKGESVTDIDIANRYFELSNHSDFAEIEKLLNDSTTYSPQNTGIYLGKTSILNMQREFHGSFDKLAWTVNSTKEVGSGIFLFDYTFAGKKKSGEIIESKGLEYVIVQNGTIQHIEIRNHPASSDSAIN